MGNVFFPSSIISGHNSVGLIIVADVFQKEGFAFIPSLSYNPNHLPQARPLGMGCLLWTQHLIDIRPQFPELFM